MAKPRSFPEIDFKSLKKGQVMSVSSLEKLLGAKYGTTDYDQRCRVLCDEIKRHARLYPRRDKGAVHLMTDEDAATYNTNRQASISKQFGRVIVDGSALVDPSKLTDTTRRKFESMQRHGAAVALELAKHAARNLLPEGE